jgi:hypothetical protein
MMAEFASFAALFSKTFLDLPISFGNNAFVSCINCVVKSVEISPLVGVNC